jgi:hypothetical protein
MKRAAILALISSVLSQPVSSQSGVDPIIVEGICDPRSGVSIDDGEFSTFECDLAVITRNERGAVMIQFTDKAGDDGRILGFAGTIEGKQGFGADATQMMVVERLYLAGGAKPILVSRGTCIMNWTGLHRTGGRLTSVLCSGRGFADGHDIKAISVLVAD